MAGTMIDELLWYSRLILWVGAIILLAEALSGRSAAIISVAGTLCLAGGFAAFLVALAVSGIREKRQLTDPVARHDPERPEFQP